MNRTTGRYRFDGREIGFDLVRKRSARRNILVRFEDDGRMKVTAAMRFTPRDVRFVLTGMHDQIVELHREVRRVPRALTPVRYRQGALHYYLGRGYRFDIHRRPGIRPHVILQVVSFLIGRIRERLSTEDLTMAHLTLSSSDGFIQDLAV